MWYQIYYYPRELFNGTKSGNLALIDAKSQQKLLELCLGNLRR